MVVAGKQEGAAALRRSVVWRACRVLIDGLQTEMTTGWAAAEWVSSFAPNIGTLAVRGARPEKKRGCSKGCGRRVDFKLHKRS